MLAITPLSFIKSFALPTAKNDEIYHLWWHPHNFGSYQENNFNFLKKILQHYQMLNSKYGFSSATMKGIASEVKLKDNA